MIYPQWKIKKAGQSSDGYLSQAPSRNDTVITSNFTNYSIGKKLCVCIIAWVSVYYDKISWDMGRPLRCGKNFSVGYSLTLYIKFILLVNFFFFLLFCVSIKAPDSY